MWRLQWAFFGYSQYYDSSETAAAATSTASPANLLMESLFHSTDLFIKKMFLDPLGRILTIFNLSLARKLHGKKYAFLICGSETMKFAKMDKLVEKSDQGSSRHHPALSSSAADTTWRRWARHNLLVHEQQGYSNLYQLYTHTTKKEEGNAAFLRLGLVRDSATAPVCFMQLEKMNPNFILEHPKCAADVHFLLSMFLMCGWIMVLNSIQRRRVERHAAAVRIVMANRRRVANAVAAAHLHQD